MDTFGVTTHGVPCELGFARVPGYCEAREQAPRQPCCATDRWLDNELVRADGRPLASHWRWSVQRKAHVRDPCGPRDRFRFPVTTSMDIGWSLVDPALCGAHFLCNDLRSPLVQSDVFRVWHDQMLHADGDELQLRTRKPVDLAELTPKVRCFPLPPAASNTGSAAAKEGKQPWMVARESQILHGALRVTPTYDTQEPHGAADRLHYLEMKRREELRMKRAQREGSRILRAQMELVRDRKDLQPPPKFLPRPWEPPPSPPRPDRIDMLRAAGAPCCALQEPRSPLQPKPKEQGTDPGGQNQEIQASFEPSWHTMVHGTTKVMQSRLTGSVLHGNKPFVSTHRYGRAIMEEQNKTTDGTRSETMASKKFQENMDLLQHAQDHLQKDSRGKWKEGVTKPGINIDYTQMQTPQIQQAHYDIAKAKVAERFTDVEKRNRPKLHATHEPPRELQQGEGLETLFKKVAGMAQTMTTKQGQRQMTAGKQEQTQATTTTRAKQGQMQTTTTKETQMSTTTTKMQMQTTTTTTVKQKRIVGDKV